MSAHTPSTNDDPDLGEMDSDEDFSFPPAERRLVTQPVDLSVHTLVDQWTSKLLILPEIQREYVWDNGKASRLIESLLLNIPIPVLYFAETSDATYEIIDGHQRVSSVARFIGNEFRLSGLVVLREYKGLRYHQLPDREQRFLRMRTLRAIIIAVDSHPNMKFEIFERLNTGAISLNAQELRNSIYRGTFNRKLRELVKSPVFRRVIGTKSPRKRMVDEELLLRFFALHEHLAEYRPPLKRFLNEYMGSVENVGVVELAAFESLFLATIERVSDLIGFNAFRITDRSGGAVEAAINRALFDAHMLASSWVQVGGAKNKPAVLREISKLYQSPEFLDSIRRATGDRSRTLRRVRETVEAFEKAGLVVAVPFDLSK